MLRNSNIINIFRSHILSLPLSMMNGNPVADSLSWTSTRVSSLSLFEQSIALSMRSYRVCRRIYALQDSPDKFNGAASLGGRRKNNRRI